MKKITNFSVLLAVLLAGAATTQAQNSIYNTATLFRGSITNAQTVTADILRTNTTTVITTNANGSISTNVTRAVTTVADINTSWIDLALSPAGGVCPVDIQIYSLGTNATTSNVVATLELTVNKRRPITTRVTVTNVLTGTTNSVSKATIAAATFGNAQSFRLLSVGTAAITTISVEVDYGYWRPR